MKRKIILFLAGAVLLPTVSLANVCSDGVGLPPFLASGAKPNLLMVLDNSGSMLDAAYNEDGSFCFDDSYDSAAAYAGYFQNSKWYQWTEATYPPWENGKEYAVGDRVYVNGIIWESLTTDTSNGTTVNDDDKVDWKRIFTIKKWANEVEYKIDDIVWSGPQLYKALNNATSKDFIASDGINLAGDLIVKWEAVDSTWINGKSYSKGDIVSYQGRLYEAAGNGTASGTGQYDDSGVSWTLLSEGGFKQVNKDDATASCVNAAGTNNTHADLCVSLDLSKTPTQVSAFAARGNLLNWAMASKFDVQKKILTGGKFNSGTYSNDTDKFKDGLLVSENRGCSGSRTIKQIPLVGGKFLSMGVRGSRHQDAPAYEDRLDSTDDTGRLEILAVTDTGYQISQKCLDAIDDIKKNLEATPPKPGVQGNQQAIGECIGTFPASGSLAEDMRPTLNNSFQACWKDDPNTEEFEFAPGIWNNIIADCVTLYKGIQQQSSNVDPSQKYHPSDLRAADGGPYICYGVYDSEVDHLNRVGYIGRVWNAGGADGMTTCDPKKPNNECTGDPCYWMYSGGSPAVDPDEIHFKNEAGFVYQCTNVLGSGNCHSNGWEQIFNSSDGTGECDPNDPIFGADDADWEVSSWPDDSTEPAAPGNGILEAIKDYCNDLEIPELIDPSDSTGKTEATGNIPTLLRDSHLMAFLGGQDPLATIKGHIKQTSRPEGVIHNVAQDLRLGAMSFHYVGAKTECDLAAANPDSKLQKYCPHGNRDGAKVLKNTQNKVIETADLVIENDSTYDNGKRRHVDELAGLINGVRATSWTPLGEALFSALGYYSQNSELCLNFDANGNCLDFPLIDDPVQFWCQANHILVITEGESTADVNVEVAAFPQDKHFLSKETGDDLTGDEDDDASGGCADALYSSTFLDDMTWWGQNILPLYKDRYVTDPDGNKNEKQTVYTHIVTTGALTSGGTGECSPATLMTNAAVNGGTTNYYPGENPDQLEDNLYAVFDDILSRSSAGSAASVISSSRSGAGAVYQAVFWPQFEDDAVPEANKVSWVGDVHALFVSSEGLMYEDTNQNGRLDTAGDNRILFYFSTSANKTRGCYDVDAFMANGFQCPEPAPAADDLSPLCTASDVCVELQDIKYIWSANNQLRKMDNVATDRKIFTWNDVDNDGIVDTTTGTNEWLRLLSSTQAGSPDWADLNLKTKGFGRGSVTKDFLTADDWTSFVQYDPTKTEEDIEQDALDALIEWIQGADSLNEETDDGDATTVDDINGNGRLDKALRSRQFKIGDETKEWLLGDIIHSTPIVVAKPAEAYHYIYRDPTYAKFFVHWKNRRNMIYFGA
ncbi:MAG: hypothetical protein D3923_02855, partial [Candidatus Electrothrix sp. AR3]|nr:hypothetical protein [Candidatus Electrothrix sp. AR3]